MSSLQTDLQFSPHGHGGFIDFQCNFAKYDFTTAPPSLESSVSAPEFSSVFHPPSLYTFSTMSSPSGSFKDTQPISSPLSGDTQEPQQILDPIAHKPVTRLRSGNRVPRPRNAFMIFRSEFWAEEKISPTVERDHRHISRIIGHCWNQLPDNEKDQWRRKAEQEKLDHTQRYPGYRFSPTSRTKKVRKRNVKRNGKDELLRCKQVADLLLAGKQGEELDTAVKRMEIPEAPQRKVDIPGEPEGGLGHPEPFFSGDAEALQPSDVPATGHWAPPADHSEAPIFRSPLLPPAALADIPLRSALCPTDPSIVPPAEYGMYHASCNVPTPPHFLPWNNIDKSDASYQPPTYAYYSPNYTPDKMQAPYESGQNFSQRNQYTYPVYPQHQHSTSDISFDPDFLSASAEGIRFRDPFTYYEPPVSSFSCSSLPQPLDFFWWT